MPPANAIVVEDWGDVNGKPVQLYTMTNASGATVKITNYGATITSWMVPDKDGNFGDIELGYDTLARYLEPGPPFGAVIGRYANRIGGAHFSLDGQVYTLAMNNGPNSLHGGIKGFNKYVWDAAIDSTRSNSVVFTHVSPDGNEGYPGTLMVSVRYTFTDDNELKINYSATTDKPTVVNFTNHSYFNLSGDHSKTVLNMMAWINADQYTPMDSTLIPTGEIAQVKGTRYDFTTPHTIGGRGEQGYDNNFVLNARPDTITHAASVVDPESGRKLDVYTTEPGMQFYTANGLSGMGSNGVPFGSQKAFCLETQHFPDSPNKENFPSTVLRPGETFHSETIYKTSVAK